MTVSLVTAWHDEINWDVCIQHQVFEASLEFILDTVSRKHILSLVFDKLSMLVHCTTMGFDAIGEKTNQIVHLDKS